MKKRVFAAVLFSVILFAVSTYADSMRCKGRIINTGDTTTQVRLTCGEPISVEVFETQKVVKKEEDSKKKESAHETLVEEKWAYNLGRGKMLKILTFHNGILKKIESGLRMK